MRSWWVFPSPFNLDICTVNWTTETERFQWEKAALNPLVSRWSVSVEFSFCRGKTRLTTPANKRANSQNFKIKNLNLLTINFLAVYLMNRGKSSYVNQSSMRVNNTFPFDYWLFLKKTLSWQSLPNQFRCCFSKVSTRFFSLTRCLIDRCQILTDTCKNNVSKFIWKPFKSLLSLRKWKCFGEASLFHLHHLYFNYHLLAQKLFSLWRILPYLQP